MSNITEQFFLLTILVKINRLITKVNFQFEGDDKTIAMAIMNIQDRIEYCTSQQQSRIGIKNDSFTGSPLNIFLN
jgi:hypothetical protein